MLPIYAITSEGTDADVREQQLFSGIGKLADFQLKLHVNHDAKQPVCRLPFGLRDNVDEKLDELWKKDIIEEVSSSQPSWCLRW